MKFRGSYSIAELGFVRLSVMILFTGLLVGCDMKPKHVLSESKMVDLLVDMQIAETYSDNEFLGSDRSERREELAQAVLSYHKVTQEDLDSSYSWYGRNYDKYSELYEKVDKELVKRQKQFGNKRNDNGSNGVAGSIWPMSQHGMISSLGSSDGWVLSLPNPELEAGDRIEWRLHLNGQPNLIATLGVEYSDGSVENTTTTLVGRDRMEIFLQTDTSKIATRLFGTLRTREETQLPIFVDSIRMLRLPYDSTLYMRGRSHGRYAPPHRIKRDSLIPDTVSTLLSDSLLQDKMPVRISQNREVGINNHKSASGRLTPGRRRATVNRAIQETAK